MPKDYSPVAVYYNKDLFKAAGLKFPSRELDVGAVPPATPSSSPRMAWRAYGRDDWPRLVDAVVRSLGGHLIAPDGSKVQGYMDSPATVKAITFWINLLTKDKVAPTPTAAKAVNGDRFASQKAAMRSPASGRRSA